MGVAEGEQVLSRRLSMLDLAVPLADNDRSPSRFCYLFCLLPVACLPEKGQLVHEDERRHSTIERLDALKNIVVVVVNDKKYNQDRYFPNTKQTTDVVL